MKNLPALPANISDVCAERDTSLELIDEAIDGMLKSWGKAQEALTVKKSAGRGRSTSFNNVGLEHVLQSSTLSTSEEMLESFRKGLDACCWNRIFDEVGIRELMDAQAIKEWNAQISNDVPHFTEANVRATFQNLIGQGDEIFRRGVARVFSNLDRRFKSHDVFKLGSRIVLNRVFDDWGTWNYHSQAKEKIIDVERAFAKLDDKSPDGFGLIDAIDKTRGRGLDPRQSTTDSKYFKIKGFKNGNIHLWFKRDDLVKKVNKLLAEEYGEVLPDAFTEKPEDKFKSSSTEVSKDLQFYATPGAVAEIVRNRTPFVTGSSILEPSAGEGHLLKPFLNDAGAIRAIEVDEDRCRKLQMLGSNIQVTRTNFLTFETDELFDFVLMNPPFYATHWMQHVHHAWKFVKPGGSLVSVLPVTARIAQSSKHIAFRKWVDEQVRNRYAYSHFYDLPQESFKSSGTSINTVILEMRKPY